MGPILVVLAVMLVVFYSPRVGHAAVLPDPFDPAALDPPAADPFLLDIVLTGVEEVSARDLRRLRDEVSQLWTAAGITLRWLARPEPSRPHVDARITWTPPQSDARAVDDGGAHALGWIPFLDGRPTGGPIVISATAALDLIRAVPREGPPLDSLPRAIRDRLLMRVLARVLAHELGHYLLGPEHTSTGLMRTRFSGAHLLDPSLARYRLTTLQTARVLAMRHAPSAPGAAALGSSARGTASALRAP
jgi:hypothetical protein